MNEFIGWLALGVSSGFVYALLALGIVLIFKGSRILNFAHPYFGLLCAFLAWWFTDKASFPPFSWLPFDAGTRPRFVIGALLALLLIALNGWAIEHTVIRRLRGAPRLVLLVATLAVAQGALGTVQLLFERNQDQAETFRILPPLINAQFNIGIQTLTGADIQVFIVTAVVCLAAYIFFTRTKFGVAVRAAAENQEAARLLGIPANRVSSFVWVTGSLLAGVAGILITQVSPPLTLGTLSTGFLVRGLTAALIGGLTSLPGAVVGGVSVGIAESMLRWQTQNTSGVPETILFLAVIAVLAFRPGGLFGQTEETEDKVAFVPTIRELPARLRQSVAAQGVRALSAVIVVFACALSFVSGEYMNGVFVTVIAYGMVGVSLTVLTGYTGQISLGHWGLAGVGAFTVANLFTRLHVPYLLALVLTVLAGMLVSLIIGLPALRIRGLYLAVATLAFNVAAEIYLFKTHLVGGSTAGIQVEAPKLGPINLDSNSNRPMFFFSLFVLLLSLIVARNLARTRTGRGFYALRENEKAAATLGVDLTRYKLLSFAVSGGNAALAGAVYVTYLGFAESTTWTTNRSIVLVSMVMIGGLGSLSGSIFGALVVFGLPLFFHNSNPWVVSIGTGILLIIVIVRARGGIAGLVQAGRTRLIGALDELAQEATPATRPP